MPLQYIRDDSGYTTAVIIPIEEWKRIVSTHTDLKQLEHSKKPERSDNLKPSDLTGALSDEGYNALHQHVKQARNEWDREIF